MQKRAQLKEEGIDKLSLQQKALEKECVQKRKPGHHGACILVLSYPSERMVDEAREDSVGLGMQEEADGRRRKLTLGS